ncbi:hypothetical protein [Cuspidothrix issatschenkoi]|nr:hypothetical protein [Cuspidothrix issatschenkoi]
MTNIFNYACFRHCRVFIIAIPLHDTIQQENINLLSGKNLKKYA